MKKYCLFLFIFIYFNNTVIAKDNTVAQIEMEKALWSRVLEAKKFNTIKRLALIEQIHEGINKGLLTNQGEGFSLLALATLSSYDSPHKYAVLALFEYAFRKWPKLKQIKEIENIWPIVYENYNSRNFIDELILSGIASLLSDSILNQSFPNGFAYYSGTYLFKEAKYKEALSFLVRVPIDNQDYRRAKFMEAICHLQLGRFDDAKDSFAIVISLEQTDAENKAKLSKNFVYNIKEQAVINTARILYEEGKFLDALAYYRTLTQDSKLFYETLSEQAWAFFMAGYPNRALGANYATLSPFFIKNFNSDNLFLDSVIYYWLCNFDKGLNKLKIYVTNTKNEGDSLSAFVARVNTLPLANAIVKYAKIIEDTKSGVSYKNIGLAKKIIAELMENEPINEIYNSLQHLAELRYNYQKNTHYSAAKERLIRSLTIFENTIRFNLGTLVKTKLNMMNTDFNKFLSQARLLYLEILTAKKDILLDKERSVKGGEFVGEEKFFSDTGLDVSKKWIQDKNEFWFDELGHYVFEAKSQCNSVKK